MLYDSYIDSESCTFVHPRAWAIGGIGGIYIRAVTRTGFFVATNIKIQQSIGCVSTRGWGLLVSLFLVEEENQR